MSRSNRITAVGTKQSNASHVRSQFKVASSKLQLMASCHLHLLNRKHRKNWQKQANYHDQSVSISSHMCFDRRFWCIPDLVYYPEQWCNKTSSQVTGGKVPRSKPSIKLKVTHAIYLYLSSQISPEYLGSTPPKRSTAGMLVTCLNRLNWLLLIWWKSGSTLSPSWMDPLFALSLKTKPATRAIRDS